MPQQHAIAGEGDTLGRRLGTLAKADDVVAANRLVATDQLVAAPFAGEDALGRAALVAGAGIELAMALERPRHDLDTVIAVARDLAVALDRGLGGAHQRHIDDAQTGRNPGIEVIEDDAIHEGAIHRHAAFPRSSPASARSISSTTLSRPKSLMKAPMRGPCSLPSSTS